MSLTAQARRERLNRARLLLRLSASQWALRVVLLLAALSALAATLLAGAAVAPVVLVALVAVSVLGAYLAHTWLPGLLVVLLLAGYALLTPDPTSPWSVPVAVLVLLVHCCCALAESGPTEARIPEGLAARWLARWAVCALAAVGVWLVLLVTSRVSVSGPSGVAFSVLALLALAVLAVLLLRDVGGGRPD